MNGSSYEAILAQSARQRKLNSLHVGLLAVVTLLCLAYVGFFDLARMAEGIPAILHLVLESMPPNFENGLTWIKPLIDTLVMSVAGTVLALFLSLPLAFLAARNTSPHPAVYHAGRLLLNGLRSIPELIMGILFVAAVGFGALPGVLALGLHSIGMVGKFFAEAIEHVDSEPIEAVRATGAKPLQVIVHGILPQVFPQMADVSIYRWEYNFRASTVMGMVGAGGIGFELMGSLRIMEYRDVGAILIVILATVTVVDGLGSTLRKRFK
ncbi:MAG: phosphonate ABC transporter, permease protein PhnE [Syntrophales bacterium]